MMTEEYVRVEEEDAPVVPKPPAVNHNWTMAAAVLGLAVGIGGGIGIGYAIFHDSSSSHRKVSVQFYGEG